MKKLSLLLTLTLGLFIASCSSDDDSGSKNNNCVTCEIELFGTVNTTDYCDNGDGTVTVTAEGEEEVVDLEGATFHQFISAFEQLGSCN
ncbi:hypothetical protein [Psychroflexus planctonicus]|uniref:Lipoprotein n=1 Tax=Psychroflexus planctonicus TaxID=1526575 RepID=A0ABQ1SER5_9FLAO|nr:hypothetical protein [Psychroflexus planctonicus]GGE28092.1 hypothetical protein GCM10010832_06030 [Psychroflexus planctonicus]